MSLSELRIRIDAIDEQVLDLLSQRANLALDIGHLKAAQGKPAFVPGREMQLLERIEQLRKGPLSGTAVRAIYREIISACRNLERPSSVAYLGPEATWSHLAARQQFGSSAIYEPVRSIGDVFAAVETRRHDYGLVPVENSTAGSVPDTLDNFMKTSLKVCGEVLYQINFALLSRETDLSKVRRIYSLPIATEQCRRWLTDHLPDIPVDVVTSTAHAAHMAAQEDGAAAIASPLAGEIHGLNTLMDRIEDSARNQTRFLVLGHDGTDPSGRDKTSILFAVPHQPGSLHTVLECLKEQNINMTFITSRPTRQMQWEYVFFIDVQGHADEPALKKALDAMHTRCAFMQVLGSYPEASVVDA